MPRGRAPTSIGSPASSVFGSIRARHPPGCRSPRSRSRRLPGRSAGCRRGSAYPFDPARLIVDAKDTSRLDADCPDRRRPRYATVRGPSATGRTRPPCSWRGRCAPPSSESSSATQTPPGEVTTSLGPPSSGIDAISPPASGERTRRSSSTIQTEPKPTATELGSAPGPRSMAREVSGFFPVAGIAWTDAGIPRRDPGEPAGRRQGGRRIVHLDRSLHPAREVDRAVGRNHRPTLGRATQHEQEGDSRGCKGRDRNSDPRARRRSRRPAGDSRCERIRERAWRREALLRVDSHGMDDRIVHRRRAGRTPFGGLRPLRVDVGDELCRLASARERRLPRQEEECERPQRVDVSASVDCVTLDLLGST